MEVDLHHGHWKRLEEDEAAAILILGVGADEDLIFKGMVYPRELVGV